MWILILIILALTAIALGGTRLAILLIEAVTILAVLAVVLFGVIMVASVV